MSPASGNRGRDGDRPGKPARRRGGRFRLFASFLMTGAVSFCALLLLGVLYLRAQALPVAAVPQTTEIYDLHGDLIDSMYKGQNRQIVPLSAISPYLVDATLAIEDHRFYQHFGFDVSGMARAALVDLKHMSIIQGGSTITQQLAWNLYLTHERTWERKLKEAMYTVQLEMQYSKDDILSQYLNQIYYGHSAYGIEAAAELYFGKHAKELDLAESSLLAGIPKGPRYFSPHYSMANAKARQRVVLNKMAEFHYITQQQADDAYAERLDILPLSGDQPSEAPYFRDYVRQFVTQQLGITDAEFEQGGYKVYTTLDLHAQHIAEAAVKKYVGDRDGLQAALVSIDPRNGYVKTMVGGKDYEENQFNRVFATTRQPGSSFKAILYLTALEQPGFSPATRFKSEPTVFPYDDGRKTYTPSNFGDEYLNDWIDLRTGIMKSDNIYAVNTIMQIGPEQVVDMARKLGITSPMKPLPSLALGTFPVSPFQMASAYSAIANQGVRCDPVAVLKVVDGEGNVIYEAKPQEEQIVDAAHAYVLTNLLESVFDPGGTGFRVASTLKRPVAAKTGTTDTDAWMVGFTPELATAVWVGYDKDRKIGTVESHLASPIFADFTEQALASVPPKMFAIPDGVVSVYIDPETGKLATENCPHPRLETFVQGTEPTEYCDLHPSKDKSKQPSEVSPDAKPDRSFWEDLKRWWNG